MLKNLNKNLLVKVETKEDENFYLNYFLLQEKMNCHFIIFYQKRKRFF